MSLAIATVQMRARQARKQSVMTVRHKESPQGDDYTQLSLSVSENIKDFVSAIQKTVQRILKRSRSESTGSEDETTHVCEKRVAIISRTTNDCIGAVTTTENIVVLKRVWSKPIDIPKRDRYGNRYPVYERKKFQYM